MIQDSRLNSLVAEFGLTLRQQCLLKYSRDYNLTLDRNNWKKLKNDIDTDIYSLLKGFSPRTNLIDRKLLYIITGRGENCLGGEVEADLIKSYISTESGLN